VNDLIIPDGTENPPPPPPDTNVVSLPLPQLAMDLASDFARWYADDTQAVAA
jgi:hypothetical protein